MQWAACAFWVLQLCLALSGWLLCSRLIIHQAATFSCHEQGSMKWQHEAEQELGSEQDTSHASCLAVQGSVEERIMEIMEQRQAGPRLGSSGAADLSQGPRGKKRQRAQQDLAGSLKADRQNLRTAELELLFQVTACPFTA